ncbi:SEC-C motif-containing protein [Babesia caballi]|uniref:SEC-C motif-containing protein n=1 Tax=Babesia caballi TaxID=5871 RepID=A0AAV4LML7_BABCB|nr:SEC-C motif-containing protein [Babesia caballi]
MINLTIKPLLHLLLNLPNQILKPLRHLTGAHALSKFNNHIQNLLLIRLILQLLNVTKPLEEADDKVQDGVADLMLRDVSGKDTAAGKLATTIIPNELLKSVGQFGNEATGTTISQSIFNLRKLQTKAGARTMNRLKKLRNLLGEGSGTIFIGSLPILPRHPQDPVDGLLEVGRALRQRFPRHPLRQLSKSLSQYHQ